jgi:hypothetical protein
MLYNLNNLEHKALQISCGNHHSLVLFEDKNKNKLLYSVGIQTSDMYCHLGVEEDATNEPESSFRPIPVFANREVKQIVAHSAYASMVILGGDSTE